MIIFPVTSPLDCLAYVRDVCDGTHTKENKCLGILLLYSIHSFVIRYTVMKCLIPKCPAVTLFKHIMCLDFKHRNIHSINT